MNRRLRLSSAIPLFFGEEVSCCGEFLSDESEAEQPSAHRVFRILVLLRLRAGGFDFLCQFAERQAKLNVALELSGVDAVLLAVLGCVELEKPEFNRAFCEGGVEVKHVVAAVVVVLCPAVIRAVSVVPGIR